MEDDLNFFENRRRPQFVENGRRPHLKKMEDCLNKFKQKIIKTMVVAPLRVTLFMVFMVYIYIIFICSKISNLSLRNIYKSLKKNISLVAFIFVIFLQTTIRIFLLLTILLVGLPTSCQLEVFEKNSYKNTSITLKGKSSLKIYLTNSVNKINPY